VSEQIAVFLQAKHYTNCNILQLNITEEILLHRLISTYHDYIVIIETLKGSVFANVISLFSIFDHCN